MRAILNRSDRPMRKILGAALALAFLLSPAAAQQQPVHTADQGKPGTAPWPVTWGAGLAVNADLRVGGSAVGSGNPVPVTVGNLPVTQPVSGTLAVTQGGAISVGLTSGAAVLADLRVAGAPNAAGNPIFAQITNLPATQTVAGTVAATQSGAYTVTQGPAGAAAWKVDGSGTTQPVSAASLPLPTGAATAAGQSAAASSLSSIDGKTPALVSGRQPVDGSGVTQPVSAAALPLPAGAAADVTLTARLGTLGQKTMAASAPVTIASDQGAVKIDGSAIKQPIVAGFPFTESTTVLAAGATFTGSGHNTGLINNNTGLTYFTATAFADQAGTLFVEQSLDATIWYAANGAAGTAVAAGSSVAVRAPATTNIFRIRFTNGSTAQTKFLVGSMFSAF